MTDSATTVATAGGVNRTTLPSVTNNPAAAASRMSWSASTRPARSNSSTVGRVARAAVSSVSRTSTGSAPTRSCSNAWMRCGSGAGRHTADVLSANAPARASARYGLPPESACSLLAVRAGRPYRSSSSARSAGPNGGTASSVTGAGARADARGGRPPRGMVTRHEPDSASASPGRSAPSSESSAFDSSSRSGHRSATTARIRRPAVRRAAKAMTSADAASSHCASSIRISTGLASAQRSSNACQASRRASRTRLPEPAERPRSRTALTAARCGSGSSATYSSGTWPSSSASPAKDIQRSVSAPDTRSTRSPRWWRGDPEGVHDRGFADAAGPGQDRAAARGQCRLDRGEQIRPAHQARGRRSNRRKNIGLQRDPPFQVVSPQFWRGTSRSPYEPPSATSIARSPNTGSTDCGAVEFTYGRRRAVAGPTRAKCQEP